MRFFALIIINYCVFRAMLWYLTRIIILIVETTSYEPERQPMRHAHHNNQHFVINSTNTIFFFNRLCVVRRLKCSAQSMNTNFIIYICTMYTLLSSCRLNCENTNDFLVNWQASITAREKMATGWIEIACNKNLDSDRNKQYDLFHHIGDYSYYFLPSVAYIMILVLTLCLPSSIQVNNFSKS